MRSCLAGLLGLVVAIAVVGAGVPGTSGAFVAKLPTLTSTATTNSAWTCADAVVQDRASAAVSYAFDDAAGQPSALDSVSGTRNGTWSGAPAKSVARGICYRDTGGFPVVLRGTASGSSPADFLVTPAVAPGSGFTLETWFSTSTSTASARAGKCGFLFASGDRDASAPSPDAVALYTTDEGRLVFALAGGAVVVRAPAGTGVHDGWWYHVAATYSASTGASLYLNGRLVGTSSPASPLTVPSTPWRIGYASPAGWPSPPTDGGFSGSLRFATIYRDALPGASIAQHAAAGSGSRPGGDQPAYRG